MPWPWWNEETRTDHVTSLMLHSLNSISTQPSKALWSSLNSPSCLFPCVSEQALDHVQGAEDLRHAGAVLLRLAERANQRGHAQQRRLGGGGLDERLQGKQGGKGERGVVRPGKATTTALELKEFFPSFYSSSCKVIYSIFARYATYSATMLTSENFRCHMHVYMH